MRSNISGEKHPHVSNNQETEASSCHLKRQHFKTNLNSLSEKNISNDFDLFKLTLEQDHD